MNVPSGDRRWSAAVEVLHRLNGTTVAPAVVRDGQSLLVRDLEVLVRVRPRGGEPVAAREVEVARVLAEAGVPAATVVGGRGQPWVLEGCVVTAWAWAEVVRPADQADLGRLARSLRERTAQTFVHEVARFEPLAVIRSAVAAIPVGDPQADFVRRRAHELTGAWAAIADHDPAGTAIVHGDLHVDNVLVTGHGPLLADLELAGSGPCSYDTAPTVVAVDRYGADPRVLDEFLAAQAHDPRSWPGFATCVAIYELWVTAWAVGVRDRSDELAAEAAIRVGCLRDQSCEPWRVR